MRLRCNDFTFFKCHWQLLALLEILIIQKIFWNFLSLLFNYLKYFILPYLQHVCTTK